MSNNLISVTQNADTAFSHIPIIDLANISTDDPHVRRKLAEEVRNACINVGFLYVKNHGIPEETINDALDTMKEFFSLPTEDKAALDITKTPNFKDYSAVLSSNNDPNGGGDMHEGFEFGWEALSTISSGDYTPTPPRIPLSSLISRLPDDPIRQNDGVMAGKNVWPDQAKAPGFREAVLKYYHAAVTLGKALFPLFALALDLPADFFDDKTRNSAAIMRVLHYPPQTGPADDRVIGIGAHTDFECFTILWQEPDIQALQVLNTDNKWVDAPPLEGTLVVNLGDQFARWTNDVFKSTVHRAINRSGVRRYSIPLFFGTDYDVRLEPIASCVSADRPPHYEVVTAGEYVKQRLQATYGH
ncbi:2OG-Fe-II oxygenase [Amylostereum chailletii]|nr:2OG-Fe-II oxygenase [Amylostereum chailletii]